jgi:hypothetical protein
MPNPLKLSDENKTDEFVLPEGFHKKREELKSEKQILDEELDKVKSQAIIRKQDESTQVFNLREQQMIGRVKELEAKKLKTEKELNLLIQQKNSMLHDHLRKVTEVLVSEAKKIVPLEKDLESGVTKLFNIKNEMQQIFEQNIDDRKKNATLLENQSKEIQTINLVIKETTNILQKDFHSISGELEKLYREKMEMMSDLSSLRDKISSQIGVIKLLEEKEARVKEIEVSLRTYTDKTHQISEAEINLKRLKSECEKLQTQKVEFQKEISKSDLSRSDLHSSISKMEITLKSLDQEIHVKREDLLSIDKTTLDVKMRVEDIRNEEFDLLKSLKVQQNIHSSLMTEIARLEGAKTAALKMQDESLKFLKEKKEFYEREIVLIEEGHKNKIARLDAEMVSKKIEWEQEFRVFSETKEKELEKRLAELEEIDLQELRKKQKDIASDIIDVFKKIQSKEGFSTVEQKMDEAKKDLNSVFEKHMGSLQRWKFW